MRVEPFLIPYRTNQPRLHPTVYVAPGARVVGRVTIGARSSVWFNAVLRADVNRIRVGQGTNIQDLCLVHVDHDKPCLIGNDIVVGHHACLHACTVGDGSLIGIGSIVLSGARIGDEALVGAGSLVPEGARIPPRALVVGIPARRVRTLTASEVRQHRKWAANYAQLAKQYLTDSHKSISL